MADRLGHVDNSGNEATKIQRSVTPARPGHDTRYRQHSTPLRSDQVVSFIHSVADRELIVCPIR